MRPSYYFISLVTIEMLQHKSYLYGRSPGIEVLVDVAIVIVTTSSVAISTCITATNLLAKVLCLVDVRSLSYPKTSPKVMLLLIAPHHHTAAAGGLVGK
jgi:hypothetical protein